jgi:hypothetical protein
VRVALAGELAGPDRGDRLRQGELVTGGVASPISAPPVEACTVRSTPARRAASSTRNVPVTLTSKFVTGSATDLTTEPAAARWTTASIPASAASSAAASRMSPSISSASTPARYDASPVE